jgi:sec-independent protein translocase protein TatB
MFDIGFLEILVIAVISLIVMGPERLPQALRTFALWFGRIRQQFRSVRAELEDEIGIDDVRRQLHNENILKDLEDAKNNIADTMNNNSPEADQTEADQTEDNKSEKNSASDKAPSPDDYQTDKNQTGKNQK